MNTELEMKVEVWRQKCSAGTMTPAEMTDAISYLRAIRGEAPSARAPAKGKVPKAAPEPFDLDAF
jgi:hypothetical protein